jgi:hypothetical protein
VTQDKEAGVAEREKIGISVPYGKWAWYDQGGVRLKDDYYVGDVDPDNKSRIIIL